MPLLIQAVPLAKNWVGGHYWRTPALDTLPEELEYLPREEITKRFDKLNIIAHRTYPTIWPTIVVLVLFLGLTSTAGYALSKIGSSNLAIMGQGICFLLPIIVVVWIKVRKETKARARRRFKHQSQKLLRTWTAQDTQSHAIQWKIRLRPKSVASPWIAQSRRTRRRGSSSNQSQQQQLQQQQQRRRQPRQEQELDQLQDLGPPLTHNEQQQHFHAGTTVISMTDALQLDHHQTADDHEGSDIATLHRVSWIDPRHRREHQTQNILEDDSNQRPPSFIHHIPQEEPSSPPASPSPIASLYNTFRARIQRVRTITMDSTTNTMTNFAALPPQRPQDTDTFPPTTATTTATNTPIATPATSSIPVAATQGESPAVTYTMSTGMSTGTSIWTIFKESMSNFPCCGFCFFEPKVWLIEISLRECQLDEYAVLVPSPVYCDYRLPGYDDVMAGAVVGGGGGGGGGGGVGSSSSMAAAASSSRTGLNRYPGLPPAYESESDSEGEDDYHEEDDDDDVDDDLETGGIEIQIQESAGCRLTRPPPAHLPDTGSTQTSSPSSPSSSIPSGSNASNQTSHSSPPQMEMIQRPVDVTSIIVLSTLSPTAASV